MKVLEKVDLLVINEGEAKLLTGDQNAIAAGEAIMNMGPKAVIIKRGEYGFVLKDKDNFFALPAYPVAKVKDPTGAGDSFAGALFGFLAQTNESLNFSVLKKACMYGATFASFTVQDFGLAHLTKITRQQIDSRLADFEKNGQPLEL